MSGLGWSPIAPARSHLLASTSVKAASQLLHTLLFKLQPLWNTIKTLNCTATQFEQPILVFWQSFTKCKCEFGYVRPPTGQVRSSCALFSRAPDWFSKVTKWSSIVTKWSSKVPNWSRRVPNLSRWAPIWSSRFPNWPFQLLEYQIL